MIESLQFGHKRAWSGLLGEFKQTSPSAASRPARARQLSADMDRLITSDFIWSDRFAGPVRKVLAENNVTDVPTPSSLFFDRSQARDERLDGPCLAADSRHHHPRFLGGWPARHGHRHRQGLPGRATCSLPARPRKSSSTFTRVRGRRHNGGASTSRTSRSPSRSCQNPVITKTAWIKQIYSHTTATVSFSDFTFASSDISKPVEVK